MAEPNLVIHFACRVRVDYLDFSGNKFFPKVIDRLCDVIKNLPASVIQSITGRQWILSMF